MFQHPVEGNKNTLKNKSGTLYSLLFCILLKNMKIFNLIFYTFIQKDAHNGQLLGCGGFNMLCNWIAHLTVYRNGRAKLHNRSGFFFSKLRNNDLLLEPIIYNIEVDVVQVRIYYYMYLSVQIGLKVIFF